MHTIIGIDPGRSGGLAIIQSGLNVKIGIMPVVGKELDYALIRDTFVNAIRMNSEFAGFAVIEKVHAMPKQGVVSSFNFGRYYEGMIATCAVLKIPLVQVTPQAWKKSVLAGQDWKGNKEASVQYVKRRFPELNLLRTPRCRKSHDGMADAVCIALYGLEHWR